MLVCTFVLYGFGFSIVADAQTLTGVKSRKTHAATGVFDLPIDTAQPIGGTITVDPRTIGSGHRIVFQFSAPAAAPASVTALDPQNVSIGATSVQVSGSEVIVTLTGIPNNSRVTVSLRNGAAMVYASASIGFLLGDVDNSGDVDAADVMSVKSTSGNVVNAANFFNDVGVSGAISASDISVVKSRIGQTLTPVGQAPLTIILTGTGSGVVTSTPPGISCPTVCSANFTIGTLITFDVTANLGSTITSASGPCMAGSITLNLPSVCGAVFTADTFTVSPSAGANGSISPSTPQTIDYGATPSFTVTANAGFTKSVSGSCGGALVGNIYTTNPITANCSVVASFFGMGVAVTPSAGANGVITPSTVQSVPIGATASFTVSPNANYTPIVAGTCGGSLVGLLYTTNAITTACTVSATFVRNSYSVTPSAGTNGTISPATPQTILNGATTTFTIAPALGFTATVTGTCGGNLAGSTYTTNPITGLCSVIASFAAAAPKYVATTGNDSTGDGSVGNPWKTIGKGVSLLTGGGALIVKNGVYSDKPNFIGNVPSGTATRYTTITAETPMQVRIQSLTTLGVADNHVNLSGNYIAVDGFIFDMAGTTNPAFTGLVSGNFNTISRSIFKRGGDIDAFGGLLEVTGSDTLIEDVAGSGACRYCFAQGGATATTQRNIWRRVVGRFDYSNSPQAKATFATQGNDIGNGVTDHLYQNIIAINGQNPGTLGGLEKIGGIYTPKNALNVTIQGSMVVNEGAGTSGVFMRDLSSTGNVTNSVVWDLPNSLPSAVGIQGGIGGNLTIGGNVQGAAVDLLSAPPSSLLKPLSNPANFLNNSPGAIILKQYGVSGTRWGQTGYNQLTNVDLWPWPFQDRIKSVFAESNNVAAGSSPAMNNSLRGFAANGTALYGGPLTLTSYIWEYLGSPCPSTACTTYAVTPSAGANGTISPSTVTTALPGATVMFTVTPSLGFVATVGGTCGGTLQGTNFTTGPINGPCTVIASFSQGQTYYVANSGNNANTCATAKSSNTPKQTIQSALACLVPGDTLVIRDGTYTGAANALTGLPNGAAGNYITIMAENEGNVILTSGLDMDHTDAYIIFQGLRFQDSAVKTILGNHIKFFRNEFKGGCPFGNCTNTTVGSNDFNDTADILLEDNWWHGSGGRYTVLLYNANRVVIRRGVIRHDGGWTDDKNDPEAGINFYNSTNCSAQNVIVIDSTLNYWTWQSAFYSVYNNASPNSNSDNSWLGIIALNNRSVNFPDGASLRFDGNAPQTNHVVQNAVLWDSYWGMNVAYTSSVGLSATGLTIGQNTRGSIGYGIAGGSGGTKTFTNAIVTNMNDADFSGVSATYFDTFNNGSAATGTGRVIYNPRTNGLLALMRIEAGSPLKSAGSGGGQMGAQIITRMGTAGTLHSELGWNTDSGSPLWPYPNESRLKKEMCTDAGITRGFCSATSFTQYIGSYLGNPSPY